ncbi:MAG TPA: hypothetical protein VMT89_00475, partial [Candidatus Acidoferrales bacterium]|nr:hypothetical protein [Candidatus Acidoferrales bacterium]
MSADFPPKRPWPYAVALVASAVAELLKRLLGPIIVQSTFLTSFGAIVFSAWYGGFWPAVLSTFVSLGIAVVLDQTFSILALQRDALFVSAGVGVSWLMGRLFAEQRRIAWQHGRELEQANATLRESEERFHQAFESAVIGMTLLTLDG